MESIVGKELQHEILRRARDAYPGKMSAGELSISHPALHRTLIYLDDHGLIEGIRSGTGATSTIMVFGITAEGIDFLEGDGGITDARRTITVKIDPFDLLALIDARIEASDLSAVQKRDLSHAMRDLSEQALRELTDRLISEAVDRLPGALRIFQTYADLS